MASLKTLPADAEKLLSLFVQQLKTLGITVPDRVYVTPGSMLAWDGEQLTVTLMGIDQGKPGVAQTQTMHPSTRILYASFAVNLMRAVSTLNDMAPLDGAVPDAATLDAEGQTLVGDAAALILAADAIHASGKFVQVGVDFAVGPLQPVGPEGGLSGSRLLVSVSLS